MRGMQQQRHERHHGTGLAVQHEQRRGRSNSWHFRQPVADDTQAGDVVAGTGQAPVALDLAVGGYRLLHVQEATRRAGDGRRSALGRCRSQPQGGRGEGEQWQDRRRPLSPPDSGQDHGVLQGADQAAAVQGLYYYARGRERRVYVLGDKRVVVVVR